MSMEVDTLELLARKLHARKCRSYRIFDTAKIDLYWESCDQDMYRKRAAAKQQADMLPTPKVRKG
jgi:hypothetical protein